MASSKSSSEGIITIQQFETSSQVSKAELPQDESAPPLLVRNRQDPQPTTTFHLHGHCTTLTIPGLWYYFETFPVPEQQLFEHHFDKQPRTLSPRGKSYEEIPSQDNKKGKGKERRNQSDDEEDRRGRTRERSSHSPDLEWHNTVVLGNKHRQDH